MTVLSSKRMGPAKSSCSWASIPDVSAGLGTGYVCKLSVDGRCLMQRRGISLLFFAQSMKQICIRTGWDVSE